MGWGGALGTQETSINLQMFSASSNLGEIAKPLFRGHCYRGRNVVITTVGRLSLKIREYSHHMFL